MFYWGGRRGTAAMRIEGRPYTTIERNLVERMIAVVLADLSAAFDPLSSVSMRFDRLETNPRFATIARPANAAILARFRIDMEDRGGRLELLLPYATLEPVRELLLQMFMGEKFGRDSIWENHLATELWFTEVPIEVVLDEVSSTFGPCFGLGARHIPAIAGECGITCGTAMWECAYVQGRHGPSRRKYCGPDRQQDGRGMIPWNLLVSD